MKKITIIAVFLCAFSLLSLSVRPANATAGGGPATGCGFNTAGDYVCVGSGNLRLPPNPGMPNIPGYGGPQNNNMQIPSRPPYTPGDLSPGLIIPYIPVIPIFTFPIRVPIPGVPVIPILFCQNGVPTTPTTPTTPTGPSPTGGCMDYLNELGNNRECRTTDPAGRWDCVNSAGYLGRYQMGASALVDAGYAAPGSTNGNITWTGRDGVNSQADFLANHTAQNNAINAYNQTQWGYISRLQANGRPLSSYVGQTINGQQVTQASLIAGAHGHGVGNLQRYLASNGATVHRDGNGVPITDTMNQFRNFDMSSCIT